MSTAMLFPPIKKARLSEPNIRCKQKAAVLNCLRQKTNQHGAFCVSDCISPALKTQGVIPVKNPERVATLLAELRTLAETDFERRRIEVLERDLTAPLMPEVIDDTHQKFGGFTFKQNKSGHYTRTLSIHRAVWLYYNGEIPDGYEIHHVDENKANNAIENLQCLTVEEHCAVHMKKRIDGHRKIFTCKICGKQFEAYDKGNNCFCSKKCQGRSHLNRPRPTEIRICEWCGKPFETRKDSNAKCCSPSCGSLFDWDKKKNPSKEKSDIEIRTCPICGQKFAVSKWLPKKCCSRTCSAKLAQQHRKN